MYMETIWKLATRGGIRLAWVVLAFFAVSSVLQADVPAPQPVQEKVVVDGPLAFDNVISSAAAEIKGLRSSVAGRAQIIVVPDLEAGNKLAKNLTFLARADAAGIVFGARVPIELASRADLVRSRVTLCAVASLDAAARRRQTAVEV
jgi:phosphotransacetylase